MTYDAASESRKATTSAISGGSPTRPSGTRPVSQRELLGILEPLLGHRRPDRARRDRVGPDAERGPFECRRPRQGGDRPLGRDVVRLARHGDGRVDRRDGDDGAPGRRLAQEGADAEPGAGDVDVEVALPIGERGVDDHAAGADPGAGHQPVQPAGRLHDVVPGGLVTHVERHDGIRGHRTSVRTTSQPPFRASVTAQAAPIPDAGTGDQDPRRSRRLARGVRR